MIISLFHFVVPVWVLFWWHSKIITGPHLSLFKNFLDTPLLSSLFFNLFTYFRHIPNSYLKHWLFNIQMAAVYWRSMWTLFLYIYWGKVISPYILLSFDFSALRFEKLISSQYQKNKNNRKTFASSVKPPPLFVSVSVPLLLFLPTELPGDVQLLTSCSSFLQP